ncbi:hypothetical protein ACGFX4_36130 [Kitasatospora sp. NPDC048365]|uniref:hypothetical protein n=1 Tax=Kitasatospora sp. NPDC048365 TaxID=3364050 RepID=UPI0037249399
MTVDRRPLWQPFSESATDQPARAEHASPPRAGRSLFREPADADPSLSTVPAQRTAGTPAPLGPGGLTFTAAG